jgi:hypothetical protein
MLRSSPNLDRARVLATTTTVVVVVLPQLPTGPAGECYHDSIGPGPQKAERLVLVLDSVATASTGFAGPEAGSSGLDTMQKSAEVR